MIKAFFLSHTYDLFDFGLVNDFPISNGRRLQMYSVLAVLEVDLVAMLILN